MGRTKLIPELIDPNDERRISQYRSTLPLYEMLELNNLKIPEFAKMIERAFTRVRGWFFKNKKYRLMTLPELIHIYETSKTKGLISTDKHGRAYNYVMIFENGERYTAYEKALQKKVKNLEKQVLDLKAQLNQTL